ncbi:hypothetical protein OAD74_00520 [Alphaproteobacteria bacterium]|nr:hypothetical protein [Alphaproteobacteria bacterium]
MPYSTHPKVVFGFISRPLPIATINCSQTHQSPSGIFILDNGVSLVAKRIEIIPNITPQILRVSVENSAFSSYQGRIDEIHIIERVVCFAGRI